MGNYKTIRNAIVATLATVGVLAFVSNTTLADVYEPELSIDGQKFVTGLENANGDEVYSGWRFRSPETQALQMDDFENPAFTAVERGEELWSLTQGTKGKSCAACHGNAAESMKGVRAAMPKWKASIGKPINLEQQINVCLVDRMGAEKQKFDSPDMLAMASYVGLQSRGMPVNVQTDGPMAKWADRGKEIYNTRVGQLDMSCANCHAANFGKKIRADHLSQGQINGFPVYRLKWNGLGSVQRRFKGCMRNIRAKPYEIGSDEFIALELYVASRGQGLSIETPSVRN